jgi:hypothetical protein
MLDIPQNFWSHYYKWNAHLVYQAPLLEKWFEQANNDGAYTPREKKWLATGETWSCFSNCA